MNFNLLLSVMICENLLSSYLYFEKKVRSWGHNWLSRKITLTSTLIDLNFGLPRKLIIGFKIIEETLHKDN
jgi:hypothetical protein